MILAEEEAEDSSIKRLVSAGSGHDGGSMRRSILSLKMTGYSNLILIINSDWRMGGGIPFGSLGWKTRESGNSILQRTAQYGLQGASRQIWHPNTWVYGVDNATSLIHLFLTPARERSTTAKWNELIWFGLGTDGRPNDRIDARITVLCDEI